MNHSAPPNQRPARLTVDGTPDSIARITEFVETFAKEVRLEPRKYYGLMLATEEIVTNSVIHGYQENGGHGPVVASAWIEGSALVISVEDQAVPFDPTAHPDPSDLEAPLEERKEGGLGIFLAKQNVDALVYERDGLWNRCRLIVRLGE